MLHGVYSDLEPVLGRWLLDPEVVEIMANSDGRVFVDSLAAGMVEVPGGLHPDVCLDFLHAAATVAGKVIEHRSPVLAARMPDGARLQAHIPPATTPGPQFALRRHASRVFLLDEYVREGRLSQSGRARVREAVEARENILVAGGTGSGKTTFGNALLAEIGDVCPHDRVVLLEEEAELLSRVANTARICAPETANVGGAVGRGLQHAVREALRVAPTRIICGEVRGAEALWVLKSWNTGHQGGFCTLHANSAADALLRFEDLASEGLVGRIEPRRVARAVGLVLMVKRVSGQGPRVAELVRVHGCTPEGRYELETEKL